MAHPRARGPSGRARMVRRIRRRNRPVPAPGGRAYEGPVASPTRYGPSPCPGVRLFRRRCRRAGVVVNPRTRGFDVVSLASLWCIPVPRGRPSRGSPGSPGRRPIPVPGGSMSARSPTTGRTAAYPRARGLDRGELPCVTPSGGLSPCPGARSLPEDPGMHARRPIPVPGGSTAPWV